MVDAIEQVDCWLEVATLIVLGEHKGHWLHLRQSLISEGVQGPMVHDARIAAICIANGVQALWTADRDFGRFGMLEVVDPLVYSASS